MAAEKTKIKIAEFKKAGSAAMPLIIMATTRGDAVAVVTPFLLPVIKSGELYGTSMSKRKT